MITNKDAGNTGIITDLAKASPRISVNNKQAYNNHRFLVSMPYTKPEASLSRKQPSLLVSG